MGEKNPVLEKYIKQVGALLQCPSAEKKRFLTAFREQLLDAGVDSISDIAEFHARFGAPETIAQGFLSEGSDLTYIKRKTGVRKIVLLGVLAALAIFLIVMIAELVENHQQATGHGEEVLIEFGTTIYAEDFAR
ncbi:MAG: hypothetical protein IJ766_07475 [Clostridia bacterium]|nr:hypothetical protein [Clostridia bacterium]